MIKFATLALVLCTALAAGNSVPHSRVTDHPWGYGTDTNAAFNIKGHGSNWDNVVPPSGSISI